MYGKDFEDELSGYEARFPAERKRAALLLALHAVQARQGFVPDEAVHWLAARYETSPADVQGVISFYTMYFGENPGKHVIWLCRTFSCEIMGAQEVRAAFEQELGVAHGQADPSGTFRVRWMECLAACDKAPCALIDDDMYENLTPESVGMVLEHVRKRGGGARVLSRQGRTELAPLDVSAPSSSGGK